MTRKRFIKLLMAEGYTRNEAVAIVRCVHIIAADRTLAARIADVRREMQVPEGGDG